MAWNVAQSKSAISTTSGTTVAVTLTSTPTTGHKIIVGSVMSGDSGTGSTCKDSNSNSLTALGSIGTGLNGSMALNLFAYDVPASPSSTFTVTLPLSKADKAIMALEVSGLVTGNTSAMLDGTAGTGVGFQVVPTVTYSSTAVNELLIELYGDNGGPMTYTAANSYTDGGNGLNASSTTDINFFWKNSTNGSEADGFTLSGTGAETGGIKVAFKVAAGGSTFLAPRPVLVGQSIKRGYW